MARNRLLILVCFTAFVLTSCGGDDATPASDVASEAVTTTDGATAGTDPAAEVTTTTAEAVTTTSASAVKASGGGQVEVVFDDGRSWTFDGTCVYTPDNSGPAAALWSIDAEAEDGATLIAIMAFPFDPAKTTPVLIGNIVDADENIFVLIESEDVSDGSNLILNLGLHDSVFKTVDDPIDITATATCGL